MYMLWKGLRFIYLYFLCIYVCNVYLVKFGYYIDGIGFVNWMV